MIDPMTAVSIVCLIVLAFCGGYFALRAGRQFTAGDRSEGWRTIRLSACCLIAIAFVLFRGDLL